ncbi:MAG: winged helix-turn-helix transcriptional regulator [Kurthia sp.]|nr:winged helix-turn-helix transcriptional regulator [Candidatus Kurthia equi]
MTILKAIEMFERVVITSTEHLMKEMNADTQTLFQELTKEQRDLLSFIYMKGQVSPGDLARFQGVKKSTLSNHLQKLIQGDYISQGDSASTDKRFRTIQLTAKGTEVIEKNKAKSRQIFQDLFADFSDEDELKTFMKLLTIIQNRIDTKGVQK